MTATPFDVPASRRHGDRPRAVARTLVVLALVAGFAGCGDDDPAPGPVASDPAPAAAPATTGAPTYRVEVRRTTMGIPHVKAADWQSLGYGAGHVQATDDLCTIADAMLTYRGERSRFFGPAAKVTLDSTIGQPPNLESDFFHRHLLDDERIAALKAVQTENLRQLVSGYAEGYNRYLRDLAGTPGAHAACRDEPWVRPLTEDDIWRRMHAATLAGGYANFLLQIAAAQPPAAAGPQAALSPGATPTGATPTDATPTDAMSNGAAEALALRKVSLRLGNDTGIGSNMIGFGTAATGTGSPLLFGNPHWYWRGPDRFYQMQLTIDGQLDVSGASFLGLPVVLIGFNNDIAWSHTVSTARRFGLYQYAPDPASPTHVRIDGASVPLMGREITVASRDAAGNVTEVKRTLYRSPHGPMIELGALDPKLAWSAGLAFAIRDVNEINYRTYRSWLGWAQAKSLDEFIAVQRREAAVPWVNTVAVGRNSPKAWYADIGTVPNVPRRCSPAAQRPSAPRSRRRCRRSRSSTDRAPPVTGSRIRIRSSPGRWARRGCRACSATTTSRTTTTATG